MISFDQVSKKYPLGNMALDNASFAVEDNEFVFLVGPSGAGKTTILKMIMAETKPTNGTIMVNGTDITDRKFKAIENLRKDIGIVFQDFKILPEKNIYENIALGMLILNRPKNEIRREVREALQLVGLSHKERLFPIQLSAGELQRVAIARAICGDRSIILADEPTGNLDAKTTWEIIKIFTKLEGKRTIIMATHNLDIVNSLRKRLLILKNGKIIKDIRKGGYRV